MSMPASINQCANAMSSGPIAYPQLDPQCTETMATSPPRLCASTCAATSSAAVVRHVALDQPVVETLRHEFFGAPRAREETALVLDAIEFEHTRAGNAHGQEAHGDQITSTRGIGSTKRPPHSRMPAICAMTSALMFHGRTST